MNILDENIPRNQRELLERWRIRIKQIGFNVGLGGMQDEGIISFLISERKVTFFTRDRDFYNRRLCHSNYGLVYLAVHINEAAIFVRRLLRHPDFRARSNRMGKVVRVSRGDIAFWRVNGSKELRVGWK